MKKILAVLLALTMILGAGAIAQAEAGPVEFDGVMVPFEAGFQIMIPSEWVQLEVNEQLAAAGSFYHVADETLTWNMVAAYAEPGIVDHESLVAELIGQFAGVMTMEINGLPVTLYEDPDNNQDVAVLLDGEGGAYMLYFTPADDAEFEALYTSMVMTISPYEEEA